MATRSSKYGFRLPTGTDVPDLPGSMANFSTDVETKLESIFTSFAADIATLKPKKVPSGITSFDQITTAGEYFVDTRTEAEALAQSSWPAEFQGSGRTVPNRTPFALSVKRPSTDFVFQMLRVYWNNVPRVWFRQTSTYNNLTNWSPWGSVAFKGDIPSVPSMEAIAIALETPIKNAASAAVADAAIEAASGDVQVLDRRYRVEDDGTNNTVFGKDALRLRTFPDVRNNGAFGQRALYNMKRGRYNDMLGLHAGYYLDGSDYPEGNYATRNTGVGSNTQRFNKTGSFNVSMGRNAMQCNVTGVRNTFIGAASAAGIAHMRLSDGEIVNQLPLTVSNNAALGQATLQYSMGDANVAVGSDSLKVMTLGEGNVAIGYEAMANLGINEHYNGRKKVDVSTNTAWQNLAFTITNGVLTFTAPAGHSLATGFMLQVQVKTSSAAVKSTETQFWYITGASGNTITVKTDEPSTYNLTGTMQVVDYATNTASDNPVGNIGIGRSAGKFMADGKTIANYVTNSIAIGDGATFVGNNAISLGNSSQTVHTYSAVQTRSDERDKKDIEPLDVGLDFVKGLRPVSYRLAPRYGDAADERLHAGLIAQEVKTASEGTSFEGVAENNDTFSLAYTELVPVLIRAVQELASEVAELRKAA